MPPSKMKFVFLVIITAAFGGAEAAESDEIIAEVTKDLLAAGMVVSPPNRPVTTDLDVTLSTEHDASAFDWEHSILDFLHVPKSGGSVVKQILWGWGEERRKRAASLLGTAMISKRSHPGIVGHSTNFCDLSKEEQDQTIAIWGHRGYGVHLQPGFKTSKNVKYFTILRDPLARSISQYEFSYKNKGKKRIKKANKPPFIEWFRETRGRDFGAPWHVSQSPNVQQLCCWWNPNWDHDRKPRIPNCPASAETLECAKKHIMDFVMVGIQEEFDDSISLLLYKTGMIDNRGAIRMHANTFRGKKKYVPTPEEEAEVRASSAWDYALYEFAKEKFHSDILEMKTKLRLP